MDEAREILLSSVERDARHDAAIMLRDIEAKTKEEADKRARNIISLAIQRCAADHVAEIHCVRSVSTQRRNEGTYNWPRGPQYPYP